MGKLETGLSTDEEATLTTIKVDIAILKGRLPSVRDGSMKPQNFNLVTTSKLADQPIGNYVVTSGKRYVIVAIFVEVYLTEISATAALLGLLSIRFGTDTIVGPFQAVNPTSSAPFGFIIPVAEGMEYVGDGSKALNAICTPATETSVTWKVNILGYERD
jgi:hypothetical protein